MFIFNKEPISWYNQRQAIVFTSIYEAKYIAQAKSVYKAVWIRGLLGKFGILTIVIKDGYLKTISLPTTIFANNQGVVKLIKNPEYYYKTKHIPIKYHKIRKLVAEGVVHFE